MTEQLALIATEPKLTPRQARALDLVTAAGSSGLHADELGALLHSDYRKHGADQRCNWCGATGQDLLKALRKKGLAKYRRGTPAAPGYWYATDAPGARPAGMLAPDEAIPY